MKPSLRISQQINPEGARAAGPLLYGWAKRSARAMPSTSRQIRALCNYMPIATAKTYQSLGGDAALDWARSQLAMIGIDDQAETANPGEIIVLGLPYGGPNAGRDDEGQYFSPMTDFIDGVIDSPPVMYTHGTQNGFDPEPIGKVKKRWYDRRGGWFKVQLDPQSPRYSQLIEAHETGNLYASSGAVPASYSASPDGHIDTWLVGELSLVDLRDGYKPVNAYAITKAEPMETLFTDYYGDAVKGDRPNLFEELKVMVMALLAKLQDVKEDVKDLEDRQEELETTPTPEPIPPVEPPAKADFGGKKRSELPKSAFIFPDTESFPVVTCEDFNDAVSSWGRYKGEHSFDEFKSRMIARAKKLNCTLPEAWQNKEKAVLETDTEKCESCDEAKRLADELRTELSQPATNRCAKCPDAIRWVRAMVKAGKMPVTEAFDHIEVFTVSDETFDAVKAEVEGRSLVPAKAQKDVYIAGGNAAPDAQLAVDESWMAKQRRVAGYTVGSK